jgi:hypothetical protein
MVILDQFHIERRAQGAQPFFQNAIREVGCSEATAATDERRFRVLARAHGVSTS